MAPAIRRAEEMSFDCVSCCTRCMFTLRTVALCDGGVLQNNVCVSASAGVCRQERLCSDLYTFLRQTAGGIKSA